MALNIMLYKSMSIYRHRMIRLMYKDIYLPIFCFASKSQFYSQLGSCKCMTECKFSRELSPSRDCSTDCAKVKDPESHKSDHIAPKHS
jgi:hypothetical protein